MRTLWELTEPRIPARLPCWASKRPTRHAILHHLHKTAHRIWCETKVLGACIATVGEYPDILSFTQSFIIIILIIIIMYGDVPYQFGLVN